MKCYDNTYGKLSICLVFYHINASEFSFLFDSSAVKMIWLIPSLKEGVESYIVSPLALLSLSFYWILFGLLIALFDQTSTAHGIYKCLNHGDPPLSFLLNILSVLHLHILFYTKEVEYAHQELIENTASAHIQKAARKRPWVYKVINFE